jgi:hypothetical protein
VITIRGPDPSVPRLTEQVSLAHQAQNLLVIDPDPFPVQLSGDPAIAIAVKLFGQFFDPFP